MDGPPPFDLKFCTVEFHSTEKVKGASDNKMTNFSGHQLYRFKCSSMSDQWTIVYRFTDFVALDGALRRENEGVALSFPALPAKSAALKKEADVVEERTAALTKYLQQLLCSPRLLKSPALAYFMSPKANVAAYVAPQTTLSAEVISAGLKEEGHAVYTFEVTEAARDSDDAPATWVLHKRFSDFVALSEYLATRRGGGRLPELPSKRSIGRSSGAVVKERQEALQKLAGAVLRLFADLASVREFFGKGSKAGAGVRVADRDPEDAPEAPPAAAATAAPADDKATIRALRQNNAALTAELRAVKEELQGAKDELAEAKLTVPPPAF